jgi:hypothetical protein
MLAYSSPHRGPEVLVGSPHHCQNDRSSRLKHECKLQEKFTVLPGMRRCVVRLKQVGTITASVDIDHSTTWVTRDIICHIVNLAIYYHPTVILGIVFGYFKYRERIHSTALTHTQRYCCHCVQTHYEERGFRVLNEYDSVVPSCQV